MKKIISSLVGWCCRAAGLLLLLSTLNSQLSTCLATGTNQTISALITITNAPTGTNGDYIVFQGNGYVWTNASPILGQIQSANTAAASATNLFARLSTDFAANLRFSYVGAAAIQVSTYVNGALAVSYSGGWMTCTYTTNVIAGGATAVSLAASNITAVSSLTLAGSNITTWAQIGGGGTAGINTTNASAIGGVGMTNGTLTGNLTGNATTASNLASGASLTNPSLNWANSTLSNSRFHLYDSGAAAQILDWQYDDHFIIGYTNGYPPAYISFYGNTVPGNTIAGFNFIGTGGALTGLSGSNVVGSVSSALSVSATNFNAQAAGYLNSNTVPTATSSTTAGTATNTASGVLLHKPSTNILFSFSANTDAARGVAFDAAFTNAVAGDTIDCAPGNYYLARTGTLYAGTYVQYFWSSNMTVRLNGARLYHTTNEQNYCMFDSDAQSGWSMIGPGILEGAGENFSSQELGILSSTVLENSIDKVIFRHFGYAAVWLNTGGTFPFVWKFPTGRITDSLFEFNKTGTMVSGNNEYNVFSSCTWSENYTGVVVSAGNTLFQGCTASGNTNCGLMLYGGGNSAHGEWSGGKITHNGQDSIWCATNMVLGFHFIGTDIGASGASDNYIDCAGQGLRFIGCLIDSPVKVTQTNSCSGLHIFDSCHMNGTFTVINANVGPSDLTNIVFMPNCYSDVGQFSLDRPFSGNGSGLTSLNATALGTTQTFHGIEFVASSDVSVSSGGSDNPGGGAGYWLGTGLFSVIQRSQSGYFDFWEYTGAAWVKDGRISSATGFTGNGGGLTNINVAADQGLMFGTTNLYLHWTNGVGTLTKTP